jgi:hypothetical protein
MPAFQSRHANGEESAQVSHQIADRLMPKSDVPHRLERKCWLWWSRSTPRWLVLSLLLDHVREQVPRELASAVTP